MGDEHGAEPGAEPAARNGIALLRRGGFMRFCTLWRPTMNLSTVVSEIIPLFAIPGAAAIIGLTIGRLLRGPMGPIEIAGTRYFEVEQAAGTVLGRKSTILSADTRQPVEVFYELYVPSGMPIEQRAASLRQAAAA
jgi:hypothetical protein